MTKFFTFIFLLMIGYAYAGKDQGISILDLDNTTLRTILSLSRHPHVYDVCHKFREAIDEEYPVQPFIFKLDQNLYGIASIHNFPFAFLRGSYRQLIH